MACGFPLVASLIVPRIHRRPVAYCPQGLSIPGRRQFPGRSYIPRRFPQLISFAPSHRLIRPTAYRSIRTGKQAGKARRRAILALGPVIVSPPRLFIAPSRHSCRTGGAKSVSFPSAGSERFPFPHSLRSSP